MTDPLRNDHEHQGIEEYQVVDPVEERGAVEPGHDSLLAITAIKWSAIVVIVIAVLYFLAVYILPALIRRP